jgi:NADPH2:quinone reductase
MRQIAFHQYGGPEVLLVEEAEPPRPAAGQIRIKVSHAGVNFAEVMFRRGQIQVGVPHVPGLEAVGVVDQIGAEVEDFAIGDRVAALTLAGGGQAEFALAEARFAVALTGDLAAVPAELAAAVLCNATTAVGAIELAGRPLAGERILVTAAAGGVGSTLVDLLAATGHTVWAATSDLGRLSEATRAAARWTSTYDDLSSAEPFDVVFDSVGGPVRKLLRDRIALLGRHVIMGDAAQNDVTVELDTFWFQGSTVAGYNLGGLAYGRPEVFAQHLRQALGHAAQGTFTVRPQLVAPEEIVAVHTHLQERRSSGKFVVTW